MSRTTATGGQAQPTAIMPADGPDARIFEATIKRALETLNADGGAIATLDDTRRIMVVRVRQVHPRLQPMPTPRHGRSRPLPQNPIEEAATTVLPATHLWRIYRKGERLIGTVWQTGEAVVMSGDEVRGLPSGSTAEDPPAAWHMAVPIFAPTADDAETAREDPPVIGIMSVYVNDPQWRFSQNHLHLLQAQANTLALALRLAQVDRQEQRHRRLIALLQELTSDVPSYLDMSNFYETFSERMYIAIKGMMDTEAFALAIPYVNPGQDDNTLTLYGITEREQRLGTLTLHNEQMPWWSWVRKGRTVTRITEDERMGSPELRARPWGSQNYLDSQVFVPVKAPSGVVGALLVASSRVNAYNTEQVTLLEMAGRFIGLAIEHAQMRASRKAAGNIPVTESERALSVLNNALLGLNTTLDTNLIMSDLVEQSSELTRGQVCAYLEYLPQSDELVIRDVAQNKDHPYPEALGQKFPVGNGRRRAAVNGQEQSLEDLTPDHARGDSIGTLLERYHVRAMLVMPVIHKETVTRHDKVLGLLAVFSPDQHGLFSPAETLNLMALSHVAASALNNARTYAQLRELDKLKDEFILTASHEFRTPMSAIQGFSWLIQRRYVTMSPDQAKHWAGEIMRATEQLKDMMDTLTESWRTKSVQVPQLAEVDVATTVQLAKEISSGLLAAEDHAVDPDGVPADLWVLSEQDRLRHVLSNLLVNAAKYSTAGSRITVTATVKTTAELLGQPRERGVIIDESGEDEPITNVVPGAPGPWVVVSVHDQGIGITAANQKRLFAKFVRLELTTHVRGTGLGLYICRRYIEAMGGEIWVESAPGQGSTFSFCLRQTNRPAQ